MNHDFYMRRCLELAQKARGNVGVNPLVGSVLVRDGTIIAESYHEEFGNLHSERLLLEKFDQKISSEDIVYISLEPCCHHGKTPPCTDRILEIGVRTIVFGMLDPNPKVSGKGIEILRSAGLCVIGPVLRAECEWLNRGFVSLHTKNRPWITLKKAQMKDGTTAHSDGRRLLITTEEQNKWSHAHLRAKHDAILVGVQTIIEDNPMLNTRFVQEFPLQYRVILDPNLRIPLDSKVVTGELATRTIVIVAPQKASNLNTEKVDILTKRGVRMHEVPMTGSHFDWNELWKVLTTPTSDFYGISSILVEGGAKTWDLFSSAGLIDEEVTLVGTS